MGNFSGEAGAASAPLSPDVPVVLLASAVWDTVAPVNVHQIARRLAERGHRVLFVESTGLRAPSRSAVDRSRVRARLEMWWRGVREVAPRLQVLAPLALPMSWGAIARGVSSAWVAWQVRRSLRRLGIKGPVIWAFLPSGVDVARRIHRRLLVYHCVDHYAANPGVDRGWIERAESRLLGAADLVLASSPALAERLAAERPDVHRLDNVADVELFARAVCEKLPEPSLLAGCRRPRLVYVGNLAAYRIDFELLLTLAQSFPDVELVLIGGVGIGDTEALPAAFQALSREPNVTRVDAIPQQELPAWLRHCEVGLIPFLDNLHTRGSLPLKLWEYVAAGLPVVATDLPNFRQLEGKPPLTLASDIPGTVEAVRVLLAGLPGDRAGRSALARDHGWPHRIDRLTQLVAEALRRLDHPPSSPGNL